MRRLGARDVEADREAVREERTVAPSVPAMFDGPRATSAVLTLLRDTRVGRIISLAPRGDEGEGEDSEGVAGWVRLENVRFLCLSFVLSFCLSLLTE